MIECPRCRTEIKKKSNIDDYITNKDIMRLINSSFNIKGSNEEII